MASTPFCAWRQHLPQPSPYSMLSGNTSLNRSFRLEILRPTPRKIGIDRTKSPQEFRETCADNNLERGDLQEVLKAVVASHNKSFQLSSKSQTHSPWKGRTGLSGNGREESLNFCSSLVLLLQLQLRRVGHNTGWARQTEVLTRRLLEAERLVHEAKSQSQKASDQASEASLRSRRVVQRLSSLRERDAER
uniref:Uncharacterized protein n=1 Tax=Tetraselmis sp. GSL018 TaxID=582737 RepID=A0A061RGA1_9CHLO